MDIRGTQTIVEAEGIKQRLYRCTGSLTVTFLSQELLDIGEALGNKNYHSVTEALVACQQCLHNKVSHFTVRNPEFSLKASSLVTHADCQSMGAGMTHCRLCERLAFAKQGTLTSQSSLCLYQLRSRVTMVSSCFPTFSSCCSTLFLSSIYCLH